MKWIHLSDLHIDPQSDGTSTENLREELINYINDHHITADYLFVTGDYRNAKYPRKDMESLVNAAADFMISIARAAKVELTNIHFVPGNHDLDRTKDTERIALIKKNYNPSKGIFEPEDLKFLLDRFTFFSQLCCELDRRGVKSPWTDTLQPLHPYVCLEECSLLYLNTCVISNSDQDRHDLVIGNHEIRQSLKKISKENPDKPIIILAHHGLLYLHDDEKEELDKLLYKYRVKLYLCGDKHKVRVREENRMLEITMGCSVEEIGSTAVFSVGEMKKDYFSFNAYEWKEDCYQWQPLTALNDYFRKNKSKVITKVHPISPKEIFIGRNREIDEIKRRLDDNQKIILLYGMEGIGKTELCRRILQQYQSATGKVKKIGWITYRNTMKDSFWRQFPVIEAKKEEIKELSDSQQPGYGELTDAESYWAAVKKYISQQGQDLLLIIDNANETTDLEMLLLKQLDCKIILTSRKRLESVDCINVTHLEREECLELYHIHSGDKTEDHTADNAAIENIISLISGHTLLIELLAKLQFAAGITSEDLYLKLKKEGFDLSDMTENISYLYNTEMNSQEPCNSRITEHIKKLLNLSEISQNQEKMQIMQFFSLLLPGCIITMQTAKKWLNLQNLNTINALVDDGWLNRSTQNNIPVLTMHPLIYIGICDMLTQNEALETLWVKNAAKDVEIKENETAANKINVLVPAEALINNAHIRNREYIELMGSFGGIYIANGEYQNALNFYEKLLKIEAEILDSQDIYIAKTFNTFGVIYDGLVKYNEALEWLKKGAEMHREILGDAHIDTAVSYSNVASMYFKLNMLEEANKWIVQAFAMLELLPDQKYSSNAAIIYATKGICCLKEGNPDTSTAYFKKAIEILQNTVGENHPTAMGLYANIAAIYHAQGKCAEALRIYLLIRDIYEKDLGEKHPNTTAIYRNIGNVYRDQNKYDESLKWYEKTAKIREEIYGDNHILTGYVYNDIGIVHYY